MQVNLVVPVSWLWIQGGRLRRHSWTIQAPPSFKGPPPIFRLELRSPMGACAGQYGSIGIGITSVA